MYRTQECAPALAFTSNCTVRSNSLYACAGVWCSASAQAHKLLAVAHHNGLQQLRICWMTHRLSLPFLKVTLSEIPMIAGLFDCLIPNKPIVSSAAAERALWFPQFALAIVTIHESCTRVLAIRIDRLSITLRYLIFPWSSLVNWLQRQDSLSASCLRFIYQSVMWQKPWRTVRSTKQEYLIFINYFCFITKQFDFFFAEWFEYSLEFRKKKKWVWLLSLVVPIT